MRKTLLPILALVLALALALPMAAPAAAHTSAAPFIADLIAGQNIDVGEVEVWNDGVNLHVTYVTDGWVLTETHLAVATSLDDIPQTGSGNPKVGKFPYSDPHGPVPEWTYHIALDTIDPDWEVGDTLYIAAHAVVECDREETAWGYGECDWGGQFTDGGSWATYFKYTVQ